jgi:hypothetical protein
MPGPSRHSTNAHGLVIGDLKNQATGTAVKELVRTFVDGLGHVEQDTSVVSLFEDPNVHGQPGKTIAAQVDLDIPASDPIAHQTLEAIETYMKSIPAPNDFLKPTVKHY